MKIRVSEDDIRYGTRGCSRDCVITNALDPHIRSDCVIGVYPITQEVVFWVGQYRHTAELPIRAARAAIRWDRGGFIGPFTFDLDIPAEVLA